MVHDAHAASKHSKVVQVVSLGWSPLLLRLFTALMTRDAIDPILQLFWLLLSISLVMCLASVEASCSSLATPRSAFSSSWVNVSSAFLVFQVIMISLTTSLLSTICWFPAARGVQSPVPQQKVI